ncbi:MAG: hypothetical protein ABJQ29_04880 [Luteolibacter sp.]
MPKTVEIEQSTALPETPEVAETPEAEAPEDVESAITPTTTSLSSPAPVTPPAPFPNEAMWIMIAFYLFFGVMILAFCVCNVLSGMWIKKRKNRTFSFVVAAMNCIQFPFGTALGVFTFIVLARPTVQMSYEANRQV